MLKLWCHLGSYHHMLVVVLSCSCPSEVTFRQAGSGDGQLLRAGAPGVSNAVGYSFLLSVSDSTAAGGNWVLAVTAAGEAPRCCTWARCC